MRTATPCLSFPTWQMGLIMLSAPREVWVLLRARADRDVGETVLHDLDVGVRDVLMKT